MERSSSKPGTPGVVPSKTIILTWLRSLFPDLPPSLKFEDFGDGVVYCRLLNHYYGSPVLQKIAWHPKNEYEYGNNLRQVQATLLQQGLTIPFDVSRVAKKKFLQNWQLINNFYRHFSGEQASQNLPEDNSISSIANLGRQTPTNHRSLSKRSSNNSFSYTIEIDPRQMPAQRQPNYQFMAHPQWQPHNLHYPTNSHSHSMQLNQIAQNSLNMTHYLKENMNLGNSSPTKGKWSVGALMFQNNQSAIIDRVKEILLKTSHDTQKIRQIKMLLGMPIEEEEVIKIEDDDVGHIVYPQVHDKVDPALKQSLTKQAQSREQIPHKEMPMKDVNKQSLSKASKKPFKI